MWQILMVTWVMWMTEWLIATQSAISHSEELHPSFFMWYEENLMQKFSTFCFEEHVDIGLTRMMARETCR
jgi:hypothetical protein